MTRASDSAAFLDDDTLLAVLRATEHAAVAASALVGAGDRDGVDALAVAALREALRSVPIDGRIVVGEGEKDEAPMLYAGERVGSGAGSSVDIAVDPIDGTKLAASGAPGSIAVLALAPAGSLFDPGPVFYLEKLIASGADRSLSLELPVAENLRRLAAALGRPVESLRVAVQERPRNQATTDAVRAAGAHLVAFRDGDVTHALRAARRDGDLDLVLGIGGAPEGVLTAVAVEALGGHMQGRLAPQTDGERAGAADAGIDLERLLALRDLASAPGAFVLTAVTRVPFPVGAYMKGTTADTAVSDDLDAVRVLGGDTVTDSIVVRGGRVRRVTRAVH